MESVKQISQKTIILFYSHLSNRFKRWKMEKNGEDIAIIGIGCNFPGGKEIIEGKLTFQQHY